MALTPHLHHDRGGSRRGREDSLRALTIRPQVRGDPARPGSIPADDREGLEDSAFEAVLAEFTSRWLRGENPCAEEYLEHLTPDHAEDAAELIYHEFCLAESAGLNPDPSDFLDRFPTQGDLLRRLFLLHEAFDSTEIREWAEPTELPEVGDEIGPYLLVRELGRGSFARVYLAEQVDLEHRLVVVKVSKRITPEPRLLARSRHAHIVEVLWHGAAEGGTLQLICMPFLGGATLAMVLAARTRGTRRPVSGLDLLEDLDQVSAPEYPPASVPRPAREIIAGLSYPEAIAWIVARLAEGLDHAYRRGVAHGDLKPSNILLTADGQPMLFDFNLASGWHFSRSADVTDYGGGTLAYMAPERLRGIADPSHPAPIKAADRHRADLYALGVVLLEALSGRAPEVHPDGAHSPREFAALLAASRCRGGAALIRSSRAPIPAALRSILSRCLAPEPADRYQHASELAEDLDRWRTGRPLAFAHEPHRRLGLVRRARHQRLALITGILCLAVGTATTVMVWNAFQATLREQALAKLALIWDRADSGALRFHRLGEWRSDVQDDPAEDALRHLECYGVPGPGDWRGRDDIRTLPESERADLEIWLLEQALRYAHALGERPDSPSDWQRGLALLERTTSLIPLGPLETQCRLLRRKLDLPEPPRARSPSAMPAPPRWMEEYLLGIEADLGQSASRARVHYLNVLKDRPESFWANQRAASVAFRLGDYPAAAEYLKHCVAQRPGNPVLRRQLAGRLYEMQQFDVALEECNRALALDPDLAESYRTRIFIRGRLGQLESLKADIDRFTLLTRGRGKALPLRLRLEATLSLGVDDVPGCNDWGEDLAHRLLSIDPNDVDLRAILARQLWDAGQAEVALSEFDTILNLDSEHLRARYDRAMLLISLGRAGAVCDLSFLRHHPRLEVLLGESPPSIRLFHHLSLAYLRDRKIQEALCVAQQGLDYADQLKHLRGESHYALARVYSVAAKSAPDQIPKAVEHLKAAARFSPRYIDQWFEKDSIFNDLRSTISPLLARSHIDLRTGSHAASAAVEEGSPLTNEQSFGRLGPVAPTTPDRPHSSSGESS